MMNEYAKEIIDRIKDPKWAIIAIAAVAVVVLVVSYVQ